MNALSRILCLGLNYYVNSSQILLPVVAAKYFYPLRNYYRRLRSGCHAKNSAVFAGERTSPGDAACDAIVFERPLDEVGARHASTLQSGIPRFESHWPRRRRSDIMGAKESPTDENPPSQEPRVDPRSPGEVYRIWKPESQPSSGSPGLKAR
jgi:hypothetical protein